MKNSRRRHIHLGTLEVDGVVYEESEVTNQVVQFYEKLYKETKAWRPIAYKLYFDHIGVVQSGLLERRFEREEILLAVHDMEGHKSPRLDGFTMAFYHHY